MQTFHRRRVREQLLELRLLLAQRLQLLLDLDRLEPRQLAQPDIENVIGLALGKTERAISAAFGSSGFADDADDLVDIEEDNHPPFEDVDAIVDLPQPMAACGA